MADPKAADLGKMTDDQLKAEATKRKITVTGEGGSEPTRDDYLKALSPVDDAQVARNAAAAKALQMDKTIPGGRYVREGTGTSDENPPVYVNAYDQEINDDGSLKNKNEVSKVGR